MKKIKFTKILSMILALVMLMTSIPLAAIVSSAANSSTTAAVTTTSSKSSASTAKDYATTTSSVVKTMSSRISITKDRSAIKGTSEAAVYVNGVIKYEGSFSSAWKKALEYAPKVSKGDSLGKIEKMDTVEFVLNQDISHEDQLTVSEKKLTIDLNGHILHRKKNKGTVIKAQKYTRLTIMDSSPRKQHAGIVKDNRWQPGQWNNNQGVILYGGIIAGGYHSTGDGGGIFITDHSTVYLKGGSIAGNQADVGSAVYLEDHSTLDMSAGNSQICYNYCEGTATDGGAIFLRSDCTVVGGYVHHNVADNYGGGVRAKGNNILVKNVTIYANKAEYGGGLYIERSATKQSVTVMGCTVVANYARERGGGAYLYDLLLTNMSDCTFEYNASKEHGGGICVAKFDGTDLAISGKMIVRRNYKSSQSKMSTATDNSNLYLQGNDDLIVGNLSFDSEIWIRTGKSASSYNGTGDPITDRATSASEYMFFSDNTDYHVAYQSDPEKSNYRHLYLKSGKRVEANVETLTDYSTKKQSTDYTILKGSNKGLKMPLYKGYFEFNLMSTSAFYSASPFYYSDGYFFEDPNEYNAHLATMSINMAVAAFGRSTSYVGDNAYANHFANVKQLMANIGCPDEYFFANEDYQKKPEYYGEDDRLSTIGVAISQKNISLNGDTYTLVPVAIRGGSYEIEWASNVTLGTEGEAKGFADAANQVYGHINNYIENYGLSEKVAAGKVKFWVVGYSRAGATANLTSKRLVDKYAKNGNQVFGYTFEAPMGGLASEKLVAAHTGNGTYPTIHNTVNENDFVTLVAPTEMGFIRYGQDHAVGAEHKNGAPVSTDKSSKYYERRQKMLAQLKAINPYYQFDDSWEVADINIVLSRIPLIGPDLVSKGNGIFDAPNKEAKNIYDYLRWFFKRVQMDGLDTDNKEDFREYYSEKEFIDELYPNSTVSSYMSIEEAVVVFMRLLQSLSSEEMSKFVSVIMRNVNWHLSNKEMVDFPPGLDPTRGLKLLDFISFGYLGHALDLITLFFTAIQFWDASDAESQGFTMGNILNIIRECPDDDIGFLSVTDDPLKYDLINVALNQALPTIIWFALNYASEDYDKGWKDSGMWGVGTFIANMDAIVSNHYQEVSVAWVRSKDSFYDKDLQAYKIEKTSAENPIGIFESKSSTLRFKSESGSSVYYSLDGGNTWLYYSGPITFKEIPKQLKAFSVSYGAKSDVVDVYINPYSNTTGTGTILGNGKLWAVVAGVTVAAAAGIIATVEIKRRKKKISE